MNGRKEENHDARVERLRKMWILKHLLLDIKHIGDAIYSETTFRLEATFSATQLRGLMTWRSTQSNVSDDAANYRMRTLSKFLSICSLLESHSIQE